MTSGEGPLLTGIAAGADIDEDEGPAAGVVLRRRLAGGFRLLGAAKDNGLLKRGPQVEAPLSDPQTKQNT